MMDHPTPREVAHAHWSHEQRRKIVPDPGHAEEIALLIRSLIDPLSTLSVAGRATTTQRLQHLRGLHA